MAGAISPAIISSGCPQRTPFHSKLFPGSSSVVHSLSLPAGFPVIRSPAIKVVAPWRIVNHFKPIIQSKGGIPPTERRYQIITDKPPEEGEAKMDDYYIQMLASVIGRRKEETHKKPSLLRRISSSFKSIKEDPFLKEAKDCIYRYYHSHPYGFECKLDDETAEKLKDLPPGVQFKQIK